MSVVVACTSHLLVDLPLFGGPVALVIGAIAIVARSERRRALKQPQPR
jgi:hypothetical protein